MVYRRIIKITLPNPMHNSKLVVLENYGHVPMEENPAESLAILKTVLVD
ncbi:MAG: alpha/beta hydrolase [Polaribacter sp.]|jgi:pimeloyl-ACP methyl ester carboxylesterase|nr:alpha/beta hydrolase [Polaribacter sp.]